MRRPLLAMAVTVAVTVGLPTACSADQPATKAKSTKDSDTSTTEAKATNESTTVPTDTSPDCTAGGSGSTTGDGSATPTTSIPGGTGTTAATAKNTPSGNTANDGTTADAAALDLAGGLALAGPGFDTVSPFLSASCGNCHPGLGKNSAADYAKYDDAKKYAKVILDRMSLDATDAKFMPQNGDKVDGDVTKLKAWIDGGTQPDGKAGDVSASGSEAATGSPCAGASTGPTTTAVPGGTADATTSGSGPAATSIVDALIDPQAKKDCHSQNKPFSRLDNACLAGASLPSDFQCNKASIMTRLKNSPNAKAAIDPLEAAGKTIEDCGVTAAGHLIIFMFCFADDNHACITPDKVTGDSTPILVSKVDVVLPK